MAYNINNMEFKDILRRYHISPLQYDDGVELNESDYNSLYQILTKYYTVNSYLNKRVPKMDVTINKKIETYMKRSLIPPETEEIMDVLMEQVDSKVL
jgi:GH15 family glucan-1,4-alpha-glucosidase